MKSMFSGNDQESLFSLENMTLFFQVSALIKGCV